MGQTIGIQCIYRNWGLDEGKVEGHTGFFGG